jgi:hypothetical protein
MVTPRTLVWLLLVFKIPFPSASGLRRLIPRHCILMLPELAIKPVYFSI